MSPTDFDDQDPDDLDLTEFQPPQGRSPLARARAFSIPERFGGGGASSGKALRRGRPPEVYTQWAFRGLIVVIAVGLLLVAYSLGRNAARRAPVQTSTSQAADRGAEALAGQFTIDYLTYDETKRDEHQQRLSRYLVMGADPMMGWDGHGKQQVFSSPAVVKSERRDGALWVTETAMVTGNRWVYLEVAVVGKNGSYAVPSAAWAPAPQQASWTPPDSSKRVDIDMSGQRHEDVKAFFNAYGASSQELSFLEVSGSPYRGLGGSVTLADNGLVSLAVYEGGSEREALAVVKWHDQTGATIPQSYRLRLKQVGDKWLVSEVTPAINNTGGGA